MHKPHKLGYPREVLFIDLVGPLPKSPMGMHYVMTLQDRFLKFINASLVPWKDSGIVINQLVDDWLCLFGVPTQIHTDQGTEFKNQLWDQLCNILQVKKLRL